MAQKRAKTHKHPVNIEFSRLSSAAEQQFCKLWVVGSIPTVGSNFQPLMSLRDEVLSGRVFSDGVFLLWADE